MKGPNLADLIAIWLSISLVFGCLIYEEIVTDRRLSTIESKLSITHKP